MTTQDPNTTYSSPPTRQRLPAWVWGLGACACLPVIGVLVLGVALTPVIKRMAKMRREVTRTNLCLTNVKQLATAMRMYAQDFDEKYPIRNSWTDGVTPYVKQSDGKKIGATRCPTVIAEKPEAYGYAFNSALAGKPQSKIVAPATFQMVYDSTNLAKNASDPVTSLPHPGRHRPRGFRPTNTDPVNIMGYADGHASRLPEQGQNLK